MAIANWPAILSFTLAAEGGLSQDTADPGNWSGGAYGSGYLIGSNQGISAPVLIAWMAKQTPSALPTTDPTALMKSLTPNSEVVLAIYSEEYWNPIQGALLPAGLDCMLFDAAVNTGPSAAVKQVQDLVGVAVDGDLGPQTLAAINAEAPLWLVWDLAVAQGDYYRGLAQFSTYGRGWLSRVANRLSTSLSLMG